MSKNIVLDALPTVTRNGAGRKPTIVPTYVPGIVEAAGSFVVLDGKTFKTSTAQNMRKVLLGAEVEGGTIFATTRHEAAGMVAEDGHSFVVARFVAKPKRQRAPKAEAVTAVEAS